MSLQPDLSETLYAMVLPALHASKLQSQEIWDNLTREVFTNRRILSLADTEEDQSILLIIEQLKENVVM
jgi:hypothetical protein